MNALAKKNWGARPGQKAVMRKAERRRGEVELKGSAKGKREGGARGTVGKRKEEQAGERVLPPIQLREASQSPDLHSRGGFLASGSNGGKTACARARARAYAHARTRTRQRARTHARAHGEAGARAYEKLSTATHTPP